MPLYTPDKLKEHLPKAYTAYGDGKVPGLTAVVPANLPLGTDREFFLTNFHNWDCLKRQSLSVGGKRKQLVLSLLQGLERKL